MLFSLLLIEDVALRPERFKTAPLLDVDVVLGDRYAFFEAKVQIEDALEELAGRRVPGVTLEMGERAVFRFFVRLVAVLARARTVT